MGNLGLSKKSAYRLKSAALLCRLLITNPSPLLTHWSRVTHVALTVVGLLLAEVACAVVGGGWGSDRTSDATREILVVALTVHTAPVRGTVTLIVTCRGTQHHHTWVMVVCMCVCVCACVCVCVFKQKK